MKKPEKKDESITDSLEKYFGDIRYDRGYNQCWDDREKWLKEFLPGIAEISRIIRGVKYTGMVKHYNICEDWADEIAKVISKRIRDEKETKTF